MNKFQAIINRQDPKCANCRTPIDPNSPDVGRCRACNSWLCAECYHPLDDICDDCLSAYDDYEQP